MTTLDVGMVIAARYRVLREIGRGGMGAVYAVEHTRTGDHLALKILVGATTADAARFKREARASVQIKSENVVRVIDADVAPELDGAPFLVMELLAGTNLEEHVRTHGPMGRDEAVNVLMQIAVALDRAHELGIVHRDLKPENLFLHRLPDGTTVVKLLDFGISKVISETGGIDSPAGVTTTGSVVGTPLYMAPEQAHGEHDRVGAATDVWALGLVAMRLLTGDHYWTATNIAEIVTCIVARTMPPPSARWPSLTWINPAVDAWFARSCAREPEKRWSSVTEQVQALARALGVDVPVAIGSKTDEESTARDTPPTVRQRRYWPAILLACAAVVGVTTIVKTAMRRDDSGPPKPIESSTGSAATLSPSPLTVTTVSSAASPSTQSTPHDGVPTTNASSSRMTAPIIKPTRPSPGASTTSTKSPGVWDEP